LALGYCTWYTFFEPTPPTYPLTWQSQWITAANNPGINRTHYRKKLYLTERPHHAWIRIMARDNFRLYVNGEQQGQLKFTSEYPVQFFDLTRLLRPGSNILAISSEPQTYPAQSKIAVEGLYEDSRGRSTRVVSDATWKAAVVQERQYPGGKQWFDLDVNDAGWQPAQPLGRPQLDDYSMVPYIPWLFTAPLQGEWTCPPQLTARHAYLRLTLDLPVGSQDAWLRISARQGYQLTINGLVVGGDLAQTEASPVSASAPTLDMYRIHPFLRRGRNVLAVSAYAEHADCGVLVDGVSIGRDGQRHVFGTPRGWKSAVAESPGWTALNYDDSQWIRVESRRPQTTTAAHQMRKRLVEVELPDDYWLKHRIGQTACLLLGTLIMFLLWQASASVLARLTVNDRDQWLLIMARTHVLPMLLLILFLLLGYDSRYGPAFPYQPVFLLLSLGLLWGLQAVLLLAHLKASLIPRTTSSATRQTNSRIKTWWQFLVSYRYALGIIALMSLGFLLRLQDIRNEPFGGDETTTWFYSQGLLAKGYPQFKLSSNLPTKFLTTSELSSYPMALSTVIFQDQEFAMRFPALVFGVMTIWLFYLVGRTIGDRRVGLLAAAFYTLLPTAINLTHYARYPSQLQFFALLTIYWFYQAITMTNDPRRLDRRYLYQATGAMIVTYLSWEGSAFLLPALFIGLLAVRRDFSWLADKHLWYALGVIGAVVLLQLNFRHIANEPHLLLGSGIQKLGVTFQWSQPLYDPLVYVERLFGMEHHQILSLIAAGGILFFVPHTGVAYVMAVLVAGLAIITTLLEVSNFRHVYYLFPVLPLLTSLVTFQILDLLLKPRSSLGPSKFPDVMNKVAMTACVGLVLLTTNDYLFRFRNMPGTFTRDTRLGIGDSGGGRAAAEFLKRNTLPDDLIVSNLPHLLMYYLGRRVDYYAESKLRIPAAMAQDKPIVVHRSVGAPMLSDIEEWQDVLSQPQRVWLVVFAKLPYSYSSDISDFISRNLTLAFEDYRLSIYHSGSTTTLVSEIQDGR
jgi:hypothetical protein